MQNSNYIYIETYGCSANQNNSEILAGLLRSSGYQLTNNEKIAEIIIINSCVVKGKTENKIKRRIQDLGKNKDSKNKLLIITGCMPDTDAKQIKQLNEKAILLGTHHFKDIVNLIKNHQDSKLDIIKQNDFLKNNKEIKLNLPKISKNKLISITQISEGCLGNCTYCKTKLAKGDLFSYNANEILKSIESDLKNGAKEVWLTSQDLANYNLDNGSQKLPELLNKILSLKHNFKLRLGMMDPNNVLPILDKLIEIYKNKKVYKFLHIPIQSASNKILKEMNRFYKTEDVEIIIDKFRKEFSELVIATDIIVGYPTETETDHKLNIEFLKKFRPDVFNLSKMSIHKGTQAENLKPLDIDIINKRTTELMEVHKKTALENKRKFLNKIIKVFVNDKRPGFYEARDENYNIVLINSEDKSILGKNVEVKIKQAGVHHLIAKLVQNNT